MTLSAPTKLVFFISVILAILALVVSLGSIAIGISAVWIALLAYVVLLAGCLLKGV